MARDDLGLAERFDAITREQLERSTSRKWSLYPGTIGAWVAEMDFGTAPEVADALTRSVTDGVLGYLSPSLAAELGEATAEWMQRAYDWRIDPARVHPVSDVVTALSVAVRTFSEPDTPVIVPTPAYMPFLSSLPAIGRRVIEVPGIVDETGRWSHDLDAIDAAFAEGAGTLVLCNPHNPTGSVAPRSELEAIAQIVEKHGGRVFADEIHAPLVFSGHEHIPYASVSDAAAAHSVTGTSVSKGWNVPGVKAAQLISTNDADAARLRALHEVLIPGASTPGVAASIAAYRADPAWLNGTLDYLQGNRDLLADLLAEHAPQIGYRPPEATYLAWLDASALGIDGSPAAFFRENAGVTLTDGALCGAGAEPYVRFVFATPRPILRDAVERIGAALRER